jgi:hypothetical protein
VELFKKKDSRFYWYDFKWRGKRYRRSTKEENKKRAFKIAALKLSQAMGGTGLCDGKAPSLQEFSIRFLSWVESATLAGKSKAYYCNGWRLLSVNEHRRHAPGSHNQGRCAGTQLQRFGIEHQLCLANFAPDAAQSRGVESRQQGAKVQAA